MTEGVGGKRPFFNLSAQISGLLPPLLFPSIPLPKFTLRRLALRVFLSQD